MAVLQTYYNKTPNKVLKQFLSVSLSFPSNIALLNSRWQQTHRVAYSQERRQRRIGHKKTAMSVCGRCL